jgi:hypothetical protein
VAQGVGPKFKPQHCKKKKRKEKEKENIQQMVRMGGWPLYTVGM